MQHELTAAAGRVLAEAAKWSAGGGAACVQAPAVLLGLLSETECRAASVLARHGINAEAVRRQWPMEPPPGQTAPPRRLSAELEASLRVAAERLADYPQPLALATEHVLLGLAAADHETGAWLRGQGVDPDALEAEINALYGHQPGPLPLEGVPLEFEPGEEFGAEIAGTGTESLLKRGAQVAGRAKPQAADRVAVLRIVDAAANRAREGLRVAEDYVRFVLDDAHLTRHLKQLRHELAETLASPKLGGVLSARETQADVGTGLATAAEFRREDTAAVLAANFTRLQEALRSLEEYGKVLDPATAGRFEQLRYRTYTLQRAVEITRSSRERLAGARLYVLVDGRSSEEELAALARSLVTAGVHVLQLRDKGLSDRELIGRAKLLREITAGSGTLLVVNDRPDLAALAQADGVHLGQEELSVKDARTIVGPEALIGVSTHSIEQARQAVLDGADYLGVGPTFPSCTKQFDAFPGVELLAAVAAEIRLPAFAIGGITRENLPAVLSAGFTRIAVSGAVTGASDPAAAAAELLALLARNE